MDKIELTDKERKDVEQLIEKLFSLLEIEGTFTLEEQEDILEVLMETKDTGIVIGYHGEVLESLQLILSLSKLIVTKRTEPNIFIIWLCR